jgi:hypothetical protein
MIVLAENMVSALQYAIAARQAEERANGYTGDSALVAGWRLMLSAIIDREIVVIQ